MDFACIIDFCKCSSSKLYNLEKILNSLTVGIVSTFKVSYGIYDPKIRHLHISVKYPSAFCSFEVWFKSTRSDFTHGSTKGIGYPKCGCCYSLVFGTYTQPCPLSPSGTTHRLVSHESIQGPPPVSALSDNCHSNKYMHLLPTHMRMSPLWLFWSLVRVDKVLIIKNILMMSTSA